MSVVFHYTGKSKRVFMWLLNAELAHFYLSLRKRVFRVGS